MGERITLRVYKGSDERQFRRSFEEVVRTYGGAIFWDETDKDRGEDRRISHSGRVHAAYLPYTDADALLCHKVGEALACPWMELRRVPLVACAVGSTDMGDRCGRDMGNMEENDMGTLICPHQSMWPGSRFHPRERLTDGRGMVRLQGLTAGRKRVEAEGAPHPTRSRSAELRIDRAEPEE